MNFQELLTHVKVLHKLLSETENWKDSPFDITEEKARKECIFNCMLIVNEFDYVDFERREASR